MLPERAHSPFPDHKRREVYGIIKVEGQKDRWVRCGVGFVNSDDSVTLLLDMFPVGSGKLIVRPWESREQKEARFARTRDLSVIDGGFKPGGGARNGHRADFRSAQADDEVLA